MPLSDSYGCLGATSNETSSLQSPNRRQSYGGYVKGNVSGNSGHSNPKDGTLLFKKVIIRKVTPYYYGADRTQCKIGSILLLIWKRPWI